MPCGTACWAAASGCGRCWCWPAPRAWPRPWDHPKIGDRESLRARFPATHELSAREQSGINGATEEVLTALADGNRAYEDKFGFIFIVCATGKRADEMLALLRARLGHDRATELRIAAEEQARITAIRLESSP